MTVSHHGMPARAAPLLVGREREQGILRERLAATLTGVGGLLLIGGDAGIGKTSLAEWLCHEAEESGALVLVGRCYDLTETPPYGPWGEALGRYRPTAGYPAPPAVFALQGAVGQTASQIALFQQVRDFFAALAAVQPTIVLLDDLHWADAASLDLLRFLARHCVDASLLLVVTYRDDEVTRRHPLYALLPVLEREADTARMTLRSLSLDALRTLVAARYHLPDNDNARLIASLQARAAGNAFFTTELLRALEEEGVVHLLGDTWAVGDLTRVSVPIPLRQVIDARIARLGPDARLLLTVGAIIGQEVPLALWSAVADVGEEALLAVVERAIDARILEETPDGTHVRFVHALIRDALNESLSAIRRRGMHLRVAELLIETPNPDPDRVASHFQRAGDARAATWLLRAAERAESAYAWLTAADRLQGAIALMAEQDADPQERGWLLFHLAMVMSYADHAGTIARLNEAEQLATESGDRALSAFVACRRGWVRCTSGDHGHGLPEMEAGVAALDALPLAEQTPRAALGRVLRGHNDRALLVVFLAQAARFAQAEAMAARAFAMGGEVSRAQMGLGLMHAPLGRPEEARRSFRAARDGLRALGHFHIEGWVAHYELTWALLPYRTERVEERRQLAEIARLAWERASSIERSIIPESAGLALQYIEGEWQTARTVALAARARFGTAASAHVHKRVLGHIAREQGDAALAWAMVREQLPAGIETAYGDTNFLPALEFQRLAATLALDAGDLTTACAWLEAHETWLASNGAVLGRSEGHALWAAYYRAKKNMKRAYHQATQALVAASEPRQPLALLAAHRLLGELNTAMGRVAYAATHFGAALGLAAACAAPYERALTLLALAGLRAATGQRAEATALLDEVHTICEPLGAAPALARAEALEAAMTANGAPSTPNPAGLTPREMEVMRLLVAGHTNRAIGDALFLSERTVQVHVRHILAKTGAENRAGATAFAVRHGLA